MILKNKYFRLVSIVSIMMALLNTFTDAQNVVKKKTRKFGKTNCVKCDSRNSNVSNIMTETHSPSMRPK